MKTKPKKPTKKALLKGLYAKATAAIKTFSKTQTTHKVNKAHDAIFAFESLATSKADVQRLARLKKMLAPIETYFYKPKQTLAQIVRGVSSNAESVYVLSNLEKFIKNTYGKDWKSIVVKNVGMDSVPYVGKTFGEIFELVKPLVKRNMSKGSVDQASNPDQYRIRFNGANNPDKSTYLLLTELLGIIPSDNIRFGDSPERT